MPDGHAWEEAANYAEEASALRKELQEIKQQLAYYQHLVSYHHLSMLEYAKMCPFCLEDKKHV